MFKAGIFNKAEWAQMAEIIREIVLDTETTGLSPEDGHRIIEIGALELINHMPTGKQLHLYSNQKERLMRLLKRSMVFLHILQINLFLLILWKNFWPLFKMM